MRICRRRLLRGLSGKRAEHLAASPAGRATGMKAPIQRTHQVLTAAARLLIAAAANLLLTAVHTASRLLLTAAHTNFSLHRTATSYCSAQLPLTCGNNVTTISDWNQPIMILSSVLNRWPVRPEKTLEQKPTSTGKCRRCELPNAYRCTCRAGSIPGSK